MHTPVLLLLGFLFAVVAPNEIGTPAAPAIARVGTTSASATLGVLDDNDAIPLLICFLPAPVSAEYEPGWRTAVVMEPPASPPSAGARLQI